MLDLSRTEAKLREVLDHLDYLSFMYPPADNAVIAVNSVCLSPTLEIIPPVLPNLKGEITTGVKIRADGVAQFRAIFEKLDATPEALALVNRYNADSLFFCAYIREDGNLELNHFARIFDPETVVPYTREYLKQFYHLSDEPLVRRLSQLTFE